MATTSSTRGNVSEDSRDTVLACTGAAREQWREQWRERDVSGAAALHGQLAVRVRSSVSHTKVGHCVYTVTYTQRTEL